MELTEKRDECMVGGGGWFAFPLVAKKWVFLGMRYGVMEGNCPSVVFQRVPIQEDVWNGARTPAQC